MTDSLLQTAAARLSYLGDVQNLLAGNLANVDTPGYQPASAISFSDFVNNASGTLPMLQTDANDLPGSIPQTIADPVTSTAEHSPDGNAVSLDQQLVQISKNETEQQFSANLYQSYMGMFKTALGSTGS